MSILNNFGQSLLALNISTNTIVVAVSMIAIPIILIIAFIIGLVRNRNLRQQGKRQVANFNDILSQSDFNEGSAVEKLENVKARLDDEDMIDVLDDLGQRSERVYRGKWLPDPEPIFQRKDIFEIYRCEKNNRMLAAIFLVLAVMAAAFALFAHAFILESEAVARSQRLMATLIPLIVGIFTALFLKIDAKNTKKTLLFARQAMTDSLSEVAPIYQDRAGVALLISELISYGESMREEVKSFSEISSRLIDGEFAEGIKDGVRNVMENEIAPPIKEASAALSYLAKDLTERQDVGMQELAAEFSNQTAIALKKHLTPLTQQLSDINRLTGSALNMMDESKQIMNESRAANLKLNKELHDILNLMAVTRNDISAETTSLSNNLKLISESSDKLTALYMGEQKGLSAQITRLSDQLRRNTDLLNRAIAESAKTLESSANLADDQTQMTDKLLQRMGQQLYSLEEMTHSLEHSSKEFTDRSSEYVKRTLSEYDAGLAEIVERLSFTTAEIREAIDALPAAIRSVGNQSDA